MNTYPGMYCECEHLRVKTDTYLLGVLKVLEESLLVPSDTLVHVGSRVAEAFSLATLAAKDTVQVRTDWKRVSAPSWR